MTLSSMKKLRPSLNDVTFCIKTLKTRIVRLSKKLESQ